MKGAIVENNIIVNVAVFPDDMDLTAFGYKPLPPGKWIGDEYDIKPTTDSDKVNSGTYTGTGLYGESNPNSIRPNISAKVLMIIQNNETVFTLSRTESTDEPFVWFASSAKEQCNENGLAYNWIAVS